MPTPRVDKIALLHEGQPLGHNDAVAQYNDLLDLARQLETDLASAQLEKENAEQSYVDCKVTLADERYCHGQSIVSLKQAASEEIKAANERASSAEYTLAQLTEQVAIVRHNILDGCGSLESVLDSDQVNAVLGKFDLIYNAFPTP